MVKRRLVVVLNGRLSRHSCIVVPLSSSLDQSKSAAGVHVALAADDICPLIHFTPCLRWAKADCVQTVSNLRLQLPMDEEGPVEWHLTPARVELIQRAVIKALNAGVLLVAPEEHKLPK